MEDKDKILVEAPAITKNNDYLTLHNYSTLQGKMVVDRTEASLLLVELWKFINETK